MMAVIECLGENPSAFAFFVPHIDIVFEFDEDIFVERINTADFQVDVLAVELLDDALPDGVFGIRLV